MLRWHKCDLIWSPGYFYPSLHQPCLLVYIDNLLPVNPLPWWIVLMRIIYSVALRVFIGGNETQRRRDIASLYFVPYTA